VLSGSWVDSSFSARVHSVRDVAGIYYEREQLMNEIFAPQLK
jgi:hypothetical protein